jgi:hypothetical protein
MLYLRSGGRIKHVRDCIVNTEQTVILIWKLRATYVCHQFYMQYNNNIIVVHNILAYDYVESQFTYIESQ